MPFLSCHMQVEMPSKGTTDILHTVKNHVTSSANQLRVQQECTVPSRQTQDVNVYVKMELGLRLTGTMNEVESVAMW